MALNLGENVNESTQAFVMTAIAERIKNGGYEKPDCPDSLYIDGPESGIEYCAAFDPEDSDRILRVEITFYEPFTIRTGWANAVDNTQQIHSCMLSIHPETNDVQLAIRPAGQGDAPPIFIESEQMGDYIRALDDIYSEVMGDLVLMDPATRFKFITHKAGVDHEALMIGRTVAEVCGEISDREIYDKNPEASDQELQAHYNIAFTIFHRLFNEIDIDRLKENDEIVIPIPDLLADNMPINMKSVMICLRDIIEEEKFIRKNLGEDWHIVSLEHDYDHPSKCKGFNITLKVVCAETDVDKIPDSARILNGKPVDTFSSDTCRAFTDIGHKNRNEDSALVDEERGLYAVADGVGKYIDGHIASLSAVQAVALNPDAKKTSSRLVAKATVHILKNRLEEGVRSGTALTFARHLEDKPGEGADYELSHIGDSRPIVIGPSGELLYAGTPHNKNTQLFELNLDNDVDELIEKEMADFIQGPTDTPEIRREIFRLLGPGGSSLVGSITTEYGVAGDVDTVSLFCPNGSTVLLITDGMLELLSIYEIQQLFTENTFYKACSLLRNYVDARAARMEDGNPVTIQVGLETTVELRERFGTDNSTFTATHVNVPAA